MVVDPVIGGESRLIRRPNSCGIGLTRVVWFRYTGWRTFAAAKHSRGIEELLCRRFSRLLGSSMDLPVETLKKSRPSILRFPRLPWVPTSCRISQARGECRSRQGSAAAWLGHRNIQHTVRYTELAPNRFRSSGVENTLGYVCYGTRPPS